MPVTKPRLINDLGAAAESGNAALFVGAGFSLDAGLPTWGKLLEQPRADAGVPQMCEDMPLLAEYIATEPTYSRARLEQHILERVSTPTVLSARHELLARLPIDQIWTTNYDTLLEQAIEDVNLVVAEEDVQRVGGARRALIKMHGSIADGPPARWTAKPVITRTDYELYEANHPRMWALLRAAYLSRTILFLGFSFTDPNVDILLKLSRQLGTSVGDRHMTVLKRPDGTDPDDHRFYDLRVRDLEATGVRVLEIQDYSELDGLLEGLVRRTRPQRLFVSGGFRDSDPTEPAFKEYCRHVARSLADRPKWQVTSLGGRAGWHVGRELARVRRAEGTYDPARIEFHFRKKDAPPEPMTERVGTAVYSDLDREALIKSLLGESRALIAIGGAVGTAEEIQWAKEIGVAVVPFGGSGGAAEAEWRDCVANPPELGGERTTAAVWERLGSADPDVAARAASRLLDQAMYYAAGAP